MRIATAFFLLIVLILVVFGLCGYLMKEVDAIKGQTDVCLKENKDLKQSLSDLQAAFNSTNDAYNDLKVKYITLLSSPFTTRETTPAFMAGSLLMGSILTLGITRIKKTSNPTPQSQIVTRQGTRNHQVTITMNAQTYANFQKYLQRPNR